MANFKVLCFCFALFVRLLRIRHVCHFYRLHVSIYIDLINFVACKRFSSLSLALFLFFLLVYGNKIQLSSSSCLPNAHAESEFELEFDFVYE